MAGLVDEDVRESWGALGAVGADRLLAVCSRDFPQSPRSRRELMALWLARQLECSAVLNSRRGLTVDSLWSLLERSAFERLDEGARWVLSVLAQTIGGAAGELPGRSAVAAVALWYHADQPALRRASERILSGEALPRERSWLDRLVGRSEAAGRHRLDVDRSLYGLAHMQCEARFWDVPARLAALWMVRRHAGWRARSGDAALEAGCDAAARSPRCDEAPWLALMARAAVGGRLGYPWLERPVRAVLRHRWGEDAFLERLRDYHRGRPYEVDAGRIEQLYGLHLERFDRETRTGRWARRRLFEEVGRSLETNPRRSVALLEAMAVRRSPLRVGPRRVRLRRALREWEEGDEPNEIARWLAGLYVRTYDIEVHARRLVRRHRDRLDWQSHPLVDRDEVDRYLRISDYRRGFHGLTYDVGGVDLAIADKDAATAVRYYVEGRSETTTRFLRRLVRRMTFESGGWGLRDSGLDAAAGVMRSAVGRLQRVDRRGAVVDLFDRAGTSVVTFDDVADVGADAVEDVARPDHRVRTALAGVFGAGATLGEFLGVRGASLGGLPFCLGVALDLVARFPWYWGFDPRQSPGLAADVLRVTLDGPAPDSGTDPYRQFARYVGRASLIGEALSRGRPDRLIERAAAGAAEEVARGGGRTALELMAGELARRVAGRDRAGVRSPGRLAARLAGLGWNTVVGLALVHETGEAARAVLTDRFLARTYPEWEPIVAPSGASG